MNDYIYNKDNGLWYRRCGDYYIPLLELPEDAKIPVGFWGRRHLDYIMAHNKVLYLDLLFQGILNNYLAGINEQAEAMYSQLVKQMETQEGITEQLKAEDQMAWVGAMNNISHRAKEIVMHELIYTEGSI